MSWRVAKSLNTLLAQINALYPTRDKKSDGSIGDLRHSKNKSDHNPNSKGVVQARDFTHDKNTLNCNDLCNALLKSKDNRIKYIIWDKFIYNVKYGFAKRPYKGVNAHSHHLHLSVSDDAKLYDDASEWVLDLEQSDAPATPTISSFTPEIGRGAKGEKVRLIQQKLHEKGYLKSSQIDGDFGTITQTALQRFQLDNDLIADGIAGVKTFKALGL